MSTSTSISHRSRVDEDDDLDDLDDVLDEFQTDAPSKPTSASTSKSPQPVVADTSPEGMDSDFARQLAQGMASLFQELGLESEGTGSGSGSGTDGASRERQFAAAWEAMLVEGMNSASDPSTSNARTPGDASSSRLPETDFKSSVRSTMDRRREKESKLQPSGSPADGAGDSFESLLSQFQSLSGDGMESEQQLQGVLEEMMGQLMSKQVLYEPLKELYDKFPRYLDEHASTISPEDKARYEAQVSCIKRLIDAFEAPAYSDEDATTHGKIVELMSELQTHGQPPEEIMGPLPPGFNLGTDGLPEMPDGCNMN